jgi:hypothetical protein
MVVTVEQAFPHCPKALVRSDLWKAASGGRPQGVPTLGDFVAARDPEINSAAFDAAYSQRFPNELYRLRGLSTQTTSGWNGPATMAQLVARLSQKTACRPCLSINVYWTVVGH